MNLYSTAEVAEKLDVSIQHVRYLARELNVGQRVGKSWVFTDEDVTVLHGRNQYRGPVPGKQKRPHSEE